MTEATFLASGNTMIEAVNFTAELSNKILLNLDDVAQAERIDIFCNDIGDAEKLDEVLWAKPKYSIISHSLVDKGQDDLIRIGYPGTKFNLMSDCLINLSPDLPKNLDTYKYYLQLVIMDGGDLRARAADTWSKCKELGLSTKFIEAT